MGREGSTAGKNERILDEMAKYYHILGLWAKLYRSNPFCFERSRLQTHETVCFQNKQSTNISLPEKIHEKESFPALMMLFPHSQNEP